MIQDKFGKNKYASYRRQLRALRQTGTVTEYHEQFEQLRHQILLYNANLDEGFFVEEFVSGLRHDIRSAILLHRPEDLDTAATLALLQEEEFEPFKRRSFFKQDGKEPYKPNAKTKSYTMSEESRPAVATRAEDKLESLKSFRRAKGLCFTCGEKWSKTHKCPDHVPLHVIEELLETLQLQE